MSNSNRTDCLDANLYWAFVDNMNDQIDNEDAARTLGDSEYFYTASRLSDERASYVRGFSPEFADKLSQIAIAWREAGGQLSVEARKSAARTIADGRDMPEAGLTLTSRGLCYGQGALPLP